MCGNQETEYQMIIQGFISIAGSSGGGNQIYSST